VQANGFQFTFKGVTPGATNIVEASTDMVVWTPISTNVSATNQFTTMDATATNFSRRFYRAKELR